MIDESIQQVVSHIIKITPVSGKEILEIGCGDGRITQRLAQQSDNVSAIEPDSQKAAKAKQLIPNASIQVGAGENLQFLDDKFEVVIFTLSLHHHQNRLQALNEAYRVTKPGGKIIIVEPVADGELEIVFSFVNDEAVVLAETQDIITGNNFNISYDCVFTANWIFDDVGEVCSVLNSYYEREFNEQTEVQVHEFLGDKKAQTPIILVDKLRAQVIQKN